MQSKETSRQQSTVGRIASLLAVAAVAILLLTGHVSIDISDGALHCSTTMAGSIEVPLAEIDAVELRDDLDTGSRKLGIGSVRLRSGRFENDEFGAYVLHSYASCDEFVVVRHSGGILAFNSDTRENTEELYRTLTEALDKGTY